MAGAETTNIPNIEKNASHWIRTQRLDGDSFQRRLVPTTCILIYADLLPLR